ncbi:MAG: sugar phosphate isomerase/epimerase [Eubacteriales bacterium]|nr:sugar phosphate isomerase/epimerase [Eubacteriales bacterium]
MKLAVFATHLRAMSAAGMDFPAALKWARSIGIEAVEADTGEFKIMPADAYREILGAAGMRMISAHHLCRLSAADEDVYEEEIKNSIAAAEQAAAAGAKYFMLVPAAVQDIPDAAAKTRARESIIRGANRIAAAAGPMGLTLTMENFSKVLFPFSTAAELNDMADNIPSLELTLDSGNFRCIAADVMSAYEEIKHRIAFCHIKDWAVIAEGGLKATDGLSLRGCPAGRGVIPIGELMFRLKHLRHRGFSGWLVIEQESVGGEVMAEHLETAVRLLNAYR